MERSIIPVLSLKKEDRLLQRYMKIIGTDVDISRGTNIEIYLYIHL